MIPYDDLVAALTSWRERQGLPVRREDLFEVDASLAPFGVADALSAPLVPDTGAPAGNDADDVTRLGTSDVLGADESLSLEGMDGGDEESTFIGASPEWSAGDGGDAGAADQEWATAAAFDATGESPAAPADEDDALGQELDAALGGGEPTPEEAPSDPDAEATMARDDFADNATAINDPLAGTGAEASADAAALAQSFEAGAEGDDEASARVGATTESDAPLPEESSDPPVEPSVGAPIDLEQALSDPAAAPAALEGASDGEAEPAVTFREPELALEGAAPAGGEPAFQDAATAIRDPGLDAPLADEATPGAGIATGGSAPEGEPSEADHDAPEGGTDEDPFRP